MRELREAVICEPVRTPIGKYGSAFRTLSAVDLGVAALRGLLARTGLGGGHIDDVVLGHCNATSEAPAMGRVVALDAGLDVEVPGFHLDRRCGSGLNAVAIAAMQVQTGQSDLVVAGGTESMSNASFYSLDMRWGARSGHTTMVDSLTRPRETAGGRHHPVPGGMIETAENLRVEYAISREEQDELSLRSHRRAAHAQRTGLFDAEIVPVDVVDRHGAVTTVSADEHIRPDLTLDQLAGLRPLLGSVPGATVTAGNSSGQNDAAAMCVVTHPARAEQLGLRPLVRLVSWAAAGVAPARMGIGVVPATSRALEIAGLSLRDMDVIEVNEAFAAQALAVIREWGLSEADLDRVNVNGSGISLGHPIGATGARILATMAREMDRRDAKYGLETMCIGGGQGIAAVFESLG